VLERETRVQQLLTGEEMGGEKNKKRCYEDRKADLWKQQEGVSGA
jgi:hypothetical protein